MSEGSSGTALDGPPGGAILSPSSFIFAESSGIFSSPHALTLLMAPSMVRVRGVTRATRTTRVSRARASGREWTRIRTCSDETTSRFSPAIAARALEVKKRPRRRSPLIDRTESAPTVRASPRARSVRFATIMRRRHGVASTPGEAPKRRASRKASRDALAAIHPLVCVSWVATMMLVARWSVLFNLPPPSPSTPTPRCSPRLARWSMRARSRTTSASASSAPPASSSRRRTSPRRAARSSSSLVRRETTSASTSPSTAPPARFA